MSKTPTDRLALNGATMGTRWSALVQVPPGFDDAPLRLAMQAAVAEVDAQMSTWKPDSDLMRLNRAPVGEWVELPARLMAVLDLALAIGGASNGAFDIATGDAVAAWGFGPDTADEGRIRAAATAVRPGAGAMLDLDPAGLRARKRAPVTLDLNGIAKGYGVDRLAEVALGFGLSGALVGIDGELRALGGPWSVAVERPDPDRRAPHSVLALKDAAVATSGDYRHRVMVRGRALSHTMDPLRGLPLMDGPASVTVVAGTCAEADAWATALMVLGPEAGADVARKRGLDALFLMHAPLDEGLRPVAVGPLFGAGDGGAGA
ncbi:MAG: FAD:protein FMN transferase [Rhodobacter sp.]|uniref:FAD:protein FMN transferase n=1 Tax=Pararhodobacter sp. TaxID=2127056 RepID=UPI001D8964F0|nr:FAD:protein FMN transferase [Pararhodobacter sp.]MCB1346847.1 FAD:protein FMN transferase [Paracoccaceae bacterium]MCC0072716.1 FAD:protein FMN transferase [Rhodobacter sp.]HPD90961.1 FAD:protein FMN transferase [Pararhodobacter sp.]